MIETQNLASLLQTARRIIADELARAQRPVALWSSGKDSQVLLALVREARPDIPVVYLRGWDHPTKHQFADGMIMRWGLNLVHIQPTARDVVAKGDHVELIEVYEISPGVSLYFPLEAEPDHEPGADSLCGILKLTEPTPGVAAAFDCVFVGHRSDDRDPVHGAIPLAEYAVERGGARFVYPLRDFSTLDIWKASALLGPLPQNWERYRENDMAVNADYWPLCTRCLEPTDEETVTCPKIGAEVYALNRLINPEARRERWSREFINIVREHETTL